MSRERKETQSIAWARTNKNGQWEIEKDFTGSGYSFHNFLYINFGKTECLRAGQRILNPALVLEDGPSWAGFSIFLSPLMGWARYELKK
uniref:Uncharacterized protein n=1 Tax=Romanomermis culicivorax TaxID=13658 RepID=A0A915L0M0_ROMCU